MSTALCQLLYVNCSMSSAQCSMSTAQCSMSSAQCSMSSAQCSMSTALFRDLPGHRSLNFVHAYRVCVFGGGGGGGGAMFTDIPKVD